MMILRTIVQSRIPGLLVGNLEATGMAHLITDLGSVPMKFVESESSAFAVTAWFDGAKVTAEAREFLQAAATACGYTAEASKDGVRISAHLDNGARIMDRTTEFCRLVRQFAGASDWLASDPTARAFRASLALQADTNERRR
jgi:hypothetical protein